MDDAAQQLKLLKKVEDYMTDSKNPETIVLHAGWRKYDTTNAVAVPIYQTTSYQFESRKLNTEKNHNIFSE